MTANIAFALGAAVLSLAIVGGAALKGNWAVAAVYTLLVAAFIARASFGRAAREDRPGPPAPEDPPETPERPASASRHASERQLRGARFKRR